MVLVVKFRFCVMIFVLEECGVVPSVYCMCIFVLVLLHVSVTGLGSTLGVWPTMLQSAKCGTTIVLVDNCLCLGCRDRRSRQIYIPI